MTTAIGPQPPAFKESDAVPRTGLYPVALKLAGAPVLVVGGGVIAYRKVLDLLACGAAIHAVAPDWREELAALAECGRLTCSTRPFRPEDLAGARMVIAATDDPAVQETVAREAEARGIPCNVVDVNHLCTFYVPAVLRRGALTVSVSTDGHFPLLAVALRDRIARMLDARAGDALEPLAEARLRAFAAYPRDAARRLEALRSLLSAQAVDWIVNGQLDEFGAHYEAWKGSLPVTP